MDYQAEFDKLAAKQQAFLDQAAAVSVKMARVKFLIENGPDMTVAAKRRIETEVSA